MPSPLKPVEWIGQTKKVIRTFPEDVRDVMGYGLQLAQQGGKHPQAKPLKGFGDAGVLELLEDHDGNAYRAVYTVRFTHVVYVLHVFQKKSKRGIATPKKDLDMIRSHLKIAEEHYRGTYG